MPIILDGTTGITTPGITNTGTFVFQGPIQVPAGTAASPSVTTASGGHTGLYFPSSSSVALSTNGVQRFVVSASGDVGIGTSSPTAKLKVVASSATYINPQVMVGEDSDATGKQLHIGYNTTANTGYIQAVHNGTGYKDLIINPNGGNLGLGVTPSAWDTGNSVRAIQFPSGALWNFNASPGNIFLGNNYYWNGANRIYIANGAASEYQQLNGEHKWHTAPSGTAGNAITFTQAMTLDASGNLILGVFNSGIATASPTYINLGALYANTAGDASKAKLKLWDNNLGNVYGFGISNNLLESHVPISASFAWFINNSERMRINSSGYLTVPNQPMISAAHTATETPAAGSAIVQWTTTVNTVSGNWNSGTGIYTIPVAGKYLISCSLLRNTGSASGGIFLKRNSTNVIRLFFCDGTDYRMGSGTIILDCAINDAISFTNENAISWYGDGNGLGSFTIQLIG